MKTIVKIALSILLGIVFSGSIMVAQDQNQSKEPIGHEETGFNRTTENNVKR